MNYMKYLSSLLVVVILLTCLSTLKAQPYNSAIGVRLGWTSGLTFKHFFNENVAGEAIVSYRPYFGNYGGMYVGALGEWHKELPDITDNLFLFIGGGVHMSFGRYKGYCNRDPLEKFYCDRRGYMGIGVDGIIGTEYKFYEVPLTLGLDLKPYFEFPFTNYERHPYFFGDLAVSLRYTF